MGCTYYIGGQEFTEKEFKKHLAGELDNYVKKGLVDLTKIKTNKKSIKTLLFVLNSLKFPMPAIEFSEKKFKMRWVGF